MTIYGFKIKQHMVPVHLKHSLAASSQNLI